MLQIHVFFHSPELLFHNTRLIRWLLCGLICLIIMGALVASVEASPANPAVFTLRGSGRHFYVTDTSYATNTVLTACSRGYHMASLWEILDVSNPIYDTNHPDARKRDDSGYGPPSDWNGWVRTGVSSNGDNLTGTGNCNNWSSISSTAYGVSVRLSRYWETAPGDIASWNASSYACNYVGPVWCAGYFKELYLPIARKHK